MELADPHVFMEISCKGGMVDKVTLPVPRAWAVDCPFQAY